MPPDNEISRRKALGVLAALSAMALGVIPLSRNSLHMAKYPEIETNKVRLPKNGKSVCIMGAGLAGLQTAVELSSRGYTCTLIELTGTPGGKLKSWRDKHFGPADHPIKRKPGYRGVPREHGLHAVWGFYDNLREFMGRYEWKLQDIPTDYSMYTFIDRSGATNHISDRKLPSPYNRLEQLLQYLKFEVLGEHDFGELVIAVSRLMSFDYNDPVKRRHMDDISVSQFLDMHGVSKGVASYFEGILDMAFYSSPEKTSALSIACVFQLLSGDASDTSVNIFSCPPGETFLQPMANYIRAAGGKIIYRTDVNELVVESGQVKGVKTSEVPATANRRCNICGMLIHDHEDHENCPFCGAHGENLEIITDNERPSRLFSADYFICAMDVPGVQKLVANSAGLKGVDYFQKLQKLQTTSVFVVDLWYNDSKFWSDHLDPVQKHCSQFFATGFNYIGQTLNWARMANEGRAFIDVYQDVENLSVVESHIADAARVADMSDKDIADRVHAELAFIFPAIPAYADFYINKWRNYTAYSPKTEDCRPSVASPVDNLLMVGDWVNISSPALYMEKTNIAAKQACNAILRRDGVEGGVIEIISSGFPNGIGNVLRETKIL